MDRRAFGRAIGLGFLVAPLVTWAQQAGKVYRIGELREGPAPFRKALMDALRALGWVEGQNLTIATRYAASQNELLAFATDLVRLRVDLILTGGTPATHAAKEATKAIPIPIVFNLADDPVGRGLVASFARPGRNLTGFAWGLYDEKLLEVLKEGVPDASRVTYAVPAQETGTRASRLNAAARVLGVEMRRIIVKEPKDFDGFFAAAKNLGSDAALVPNVAWFRSHLGRIGAAAAKSHLPAIGYSREFAESGGLLSYGPESSQNVPRLAVLIDKILKGARPADLPVEQPTKFELVVNLNTARAIGLTMPQSVLARADEIIQ